MTLPPALGEGIEHECDALDRARLSRAAAQITSDYKSGRFDLSLSSPEARAAYLLTRLPATFAANRYVFEEVRRLAPDFSPESLLDVGAGPGTASWAASEGWNWLREFTLVERNPEMLALGKRLARGNSVLTSARWLPSASGELPASDLVVLSYVVGELESARRLVSAAWRAAKQMVILIEPGTPKNFEVMAEIRREMIRANAHVVAPCPHHNECPMYEAADWCHFAVRLERTSEHRRLKGGSLGYEDEKFSYLALSKQPQPFASARIVRHPEVHSGFIKLKLCTPQGLKQQTVTRSQKEQFRGARRAKWGDEWTNWNRSNTGELS